MEMILEYSSSTTTTTVAGSSSSPIETLVFNYVASNFGVLFSTLNNFWALIISVLSAVVSLWGIKIVSSISHQHHHVESDASPSISLHHNHVNESNDDNQRYTDESAHDQFADDQEEENVSVSSCSSLFDDATVKIHGNVKRKFILRFAIDNEMVNDVDFNDELTTFTRCWNEVDVKDVAVNHLKEDYCNYNGRSKWEKALVNKDLGWYNNQDLSSLNGSAVKLWEKLRR